MNSPQIQHLLSLVDTIQRYEERFSRSQGEYFNLFDVLHVGHYEVRTHSPMLAELLNPRGLHGQGDVFLLRFLDQLGITDFVTRDAEVSTEVSIGELGRLDIVIAERSGSGRIYIENKVQAGLQGRQLERYHEHNPKAALIFLSLTGEPPEGLDVNSISTLKLISYRTDIVAWLEACRKEAASVPPVREAITQYLSLVRRLTQQNPGSRMNSEIAQAVIQNETNLKAFFTLQAASQHIEDELAAWVEQQLRVVAEELDLAFSRDGVLRQQDGGFAFRHRGLDGANISINLAFDRSGLRDLCAGFAYIDSSKTNFAHAAIKAALGRANLGKVFQSEPWPAYIYWGKYLNWTDGETWAAIRFGTFVADVRELLNRLLKIGQSIAASGSDPTATNLPPALNETLA